MAAEAVSPKKDKIGQIFPCHVKDMPSFFPADEMRRSFAESDKLITETIASLKKCRTPEARANNLARLQSDESLALLKRLDAVESEKRLLNTIASEVLWVWLGRQSPQACVDSISQAILTPDEISDVVSIMYFLMSSQRTNADFWAVTKLFIARFRTRHAFECLWTSNFNDVLISYLYEAMIHDRADATTMEIMQVAFEIANKDLGFLEQFVSSQIVRLFPKVLDWCLITHARFVANALKLTNSIISHIEHGPAMILTLLGTETFLRFIRKVVDGKEYMELLLPPAFECVRSLLDFAISRDMGFTTDHVVGSLQIVISEELPDAWEALGDQLRRILRPKTK